MPIVSCEVALHANGFFALLAIDIILLFVGSAGLVLG